MWGSICLHHFKTSNATYIVLSPIKCVLNVLEAAVGNGGAKSLNRIKINIAMDYGSGESHLEWSCTRQRFAGEVHL